MSAIKPLNPSFLLFGLILLVGVHASAAASGFSGTMSGSWWNPERNGEGQFMTFEQVGSRQVAILAYFTYDDQGRARWLVGNIDFNANSTQLTIPMLTARGPRFGIGFDPEETQIEAAGTAHLTFIDCGRIGFRYQDDGETLEFELQRLVGPLDGTDCDGALQQAETGDLNGALTGAWWDPARSGEGQFLSLERLGDRTVAMFFYFTFDDDGNPTWKIGNADIEPGAKRLRVSLVTGSGARFGNAFSSADVTLEPAGMVHLDPTGCDGLRLRFEDTTSFGLNLDRLGGALIDLPCPTPSVELSATDLALIDLIDAQGLTGDPSAGRELPGPDAPLAELGELLFFSKRLSTGLDVACASCHHPALGGADRLAISVGINALEPDLLGPGRRTAVGELSVHRNAISFFNTGLMDRGLLWDSRIESLTGAPGLNGSVGGIRTPDTPIGEADPNAGANLLTAQARLPVTVPAEMRGNALQGSSDEEVRRYLAERLGNYGEGQGVLPGGQWLSQFQQAFNSDAGAEELITFGNIALAIGEYQRSAVFVENPWSQYVRGDFSAIDEQAKRGALLFFRPIEQGGMHCVRCHSGDLFSNQGHHRVGFPQIGPGFGDGIAGDFGRTRETGASTDLHAFRTPSLLNVELTAPYGHTGAYTSLNQVAAHYFNPSGTAFGPILNQAWCGIPPFDTQPDCATHADTVLANLRATLDSLAAARQDHPDTEMPQIPVELSNQENFDAVVAFLKTLTDPCLTDRDCYSRWIPQPEQAPDAQQLNAIDRNGNAL